MSQKKTVLRRRLKVWQRMFLIVILLILLSLSSTLFSDFSNPRTADDAAAEAESTGAPDWEEPIYAYVVSQEGNLTVPFYNEALAEKARCGRGTYIEMESWEPFVAEDGTEYYHVYFNGELGYLRCENISDDKSDIIQETQVYVRTTVDLLAEPDGIALGQLAQKGDLLRIVGYDYLTPSGKVNMYEVKLGTEIGWIHADYVVPTYAEALENWNNEANVYNNHVIRGDSYGGGDAATLDYWPHEKGDFADQGNEMPESVYALYIPASSTSPDKVQTFMDMAEGTAINTFVITIYDESEMAYESPWVGTYGLLDDYTVHNTMEEFRTAIQMLQDAGYYLVARMTTFSDYVLAKNFPQWSITDLAGQPMSINSTYWPTPYSRDVWQFKVGLALEAVDTFGFNEIQFDYVRFPDYIINYEKEGSVDLKNGYGESKAQAVQRFLMYATDQIHSHGAYVGADVFGETSNNYVAPYGQYWDAISTVVDVISGMPYPDHYSSYYRNGTYFRPYKHPYTTIHDWSVHVVMRQNECSSPAIVRTWVQTWSDADYQYDEMALKRQITALYDCDLTGGYMPWHSYGSVAIAENLGDSINYDYYDLYQQAEEQDILLSELMGIDTSE